MTQIISEADADLMRRGHAAIHEVVVSAIALGYEGLHVENVPNAVGPDPVRLLDFSGRCLAYWLWTKDLEGVPEFRINTIAMVEQDGAYKVFA